MEIASGVPDMPERIETRQLGVFTEDFPSEVRCHVSVDEYATAKFVVFTNLCCKLASGETCYSAAITR